jgi:hypothetical protein
VALKKNFKLNPKFYGSYKAIQRFGVVAYRLQLLDQVGENTILSSKLPIVDEFGKVKVVLIVIINRKLMKKGNKVATMGLVKSF